MANRALRLSWDSSPAALTTTILRIYSFVLTHRFQKVISGLSKLHIDETTEAEVIRTVPYLKRNETSWQVNPNPEIGNVDKGVQQVYSVTLSNEPSWARFEIFAERFSKIQSFKDGQQKSWIFTAADLLGFRYVYLGAGVVLLNGKVSSVGYMISNELVFPRQIGAIASVKVAHGRWAMRQMGFEVSSGDDESPSFDVTGDDRNLTVQLTPEASPMAWSHAFELNLSCYWGLLGCRHARQIVPFVWQDKVEIDTATLERLKSNDPCPNRILAWMSQVPS